MAKVTLGEVAVECRESCRGDKSGLPAVGLEHLTPGQIRLSSWAVNTENTFTKLFRRDDMLFGRRRAYLKKAAQAPFDGICSGDITVIRARPGKLLPELLPFIIQNDDLFDFAVGRSDGSLSPRVKWENLANYTFELPPLAEQKKLAEVLRKRACIVEFKRQSERELAAWIARHFRAAGKDITDELCRYLIFITDGMMTTLGPEIQKVANYCTTPAVARSDIDAVVTPALKARTFDISNALAGGDYERALRDLRELFAMQEDCNLILGAIGSQMRRLHYAKLITAGGKGQETLMELTGLKSYPAGLTMTAARKTTERFCARAVELCLQTDRRMKTSFDDPERLLELLVAELAQEARRG